VNLLNANVAAKQRGLHVVEEEQTEGDDFKDMVTVEVRTNETTTTLSGTALHNLVHLTRVNDFHFDLQPTGKYMMFTEHEDRPGMIGRVGTIAGEHDINISFMEVARSGPRSVATMVVGLDDPVPEKVLAEFLSIPHVKSIRIVDI
jgi:D-3-phosphoglycerate dehydrogenase